jgi:hypothetical protein
MMRLLGQVFVGVVVVLLIIADVQRTEAATDTEQARAERAQRAAWADQALGVRRPRVPTAWDR